jgi:hypothetical protein
MMRHVLVLTACGVVLLASSSVGLAQTLCPSAKAPAEAPELALEEKELTFQKGLAALEWLENDALKVMQRHDTVDELLSNTEAWGIPFPNTVMIAKGTLLRQQALLERERMQHLTTTRKLGQGTPAELEKQQRRFANARRAFCKYLEGAQYVD